MRTDAALADGFTPHAVDQFAACLQAWRGGSEPAGVPRNEEPASLSGLRRDVFMFFIGGAKEKAPAAATAMRERLGC